MKRGKFGIPGKKALFKGFGRQQSCGNGCHRNTYRTKKKQKKYYLGKKKHHTLKMQVVINQQYSGQFLNRDAIAIKHRSEKSECNLNPK
jgi:hypothetical protein